MPLYEYTCESCQKRSEILVMGEKQPVCPECGSEELHKEFSTFATQTEGASMVSAPAHTHSPGCGCCGGAPGSCGLN
ncbi:MAG: zinc ribbon domain-containing protein [Puniceicoccaceae bacterium]